MVDRCPLDSCRAAAPDDEALGKLLEDDGVVGVDHADTVVRYAFDRARARTGVNDDVFRLKVKRRAAVVRCDADGGFVEQFAPAQVDRNLVLLLEEIEQTAILAVD